MTTYADYLINDPEIEAHINHFMKPHRQRIIHLENLATLTNQNMKHRDETLKSLMDENKLIIEKIEGNDRHRTTNTE